MGRIKFPISDHVMPAQAGTCCLYISRLCVFGPTGQLYDSPRHRLGEFSHAQTPKPQSGRPCSLANQVRTAPLGLDLMTEFIPRTASGAITGLARWADFEFSTYEYKDRAGTQFSIRCEIRWVPAFAGMTETNHSWFKSESYFGTDPYETLTSDDSVGSSLSDQEFTSESPSTAAAICATSSSARDAGAPLNRAR
jgi:hypothetical protein